MFSGERGVRISTGLSNLVAMTQSENKKDLNDPDNHNGVITYLEPDILECRVKWP